MSTIYIYKTDTVWGIGQSIYDEKSFNEIALSKGTTNDKPLSILFSNYEELVQYFQLPKEMNENWFADMAKLEMSFILPVQWLKKEIPSFNYGKQNYISIRYLTYEHLQFIRRELGAPFTTTSVNRTGEKPADTIQEAIHFQKQFCPQAKLIDEENFSMSGVSSTMVKFEIDKSCSFIRRGRFANEISQKLTFAHFKLL